MTSVTIPDSVTSIGDDVFYGCTGLTSITIPDSVTNIGDLAFYNCTSLTSITIPDSVTSIGDNAFYNTAWYNNQPDGLVYAGKVAYEYKGEMPENTEIVLQDGTLGIADSAFEDCTGLTSITIPNCVTSIGISAFYGCTGLTSITIPDSVTSIGNEAFRGCTGLTSVTIPDSVTSIEDWTFHSCTGLTSITIPDGVTSIGWQAFSGCSGLTSITIPDGVTSIGIYAFSYCTGLTSVTIGNSVTSIGGNAFLGCTGLTSITIPDSVTSIGSYAFDYTAWYNNQPDGLVYAGKVAYQYKGEMPENTEIVLQDGTLGIADYAFSYCTGLTSITIPDSVTSIGSYAFFDCTGLISVTIPDSVTDIGQNAFGYYYDWNNYEYIKTDDFTITGYAGTAAETYAIDKSFEFVSLGSSLKDNETGISVTLNNEAELIVATLTDSERIDKANVALVGKAELLALYDISLIKDGVAVQPDGTAKVKIPTDNENAKVYRIEADGTATDMNAVYENGYLVFTTDHFSVYAVAQSHKAALGDINGDGNITIADAIMLQKHIANVITLDGDTLTVADVNGDGDVSIADAIMIQKYIANVITEL